MRLRNIPGADDVIMRHPLAVKQEKEYRGKWNTLFGNGHPIHIEIGMGKGQFILTLAKQNPNINYIGIERYSSVLLRGLQKRAEMEISNIYFMRIDALELEEVFDEGEVDRIYLNFSDPWPKDRHAKRRLTSDRFLPIYDKILKKDGMIEFKTDNQGLFNYSMESIPEAGWTIEAATFDLHNSWMNEGNVMTEYEIKFSSEGNPICKLIATRGLHKD